MLFSSLGTVALFIIGCLTLLLVLVIKAVGKAKFKLSDPNKDRREWLKQNAGRQVCIRFKKSASSYEYNECVGEVLDTYIYKQVSYLELTNISGNDGSKDLLRINLNDISACELCN